MNNTFKFKHDSENMNEALGYSRKTEMRAIEIIFFSTFSNYFLGKELFDDEDQIPASLRTVTGDLEKCLSLIQTEEEKDILLLNFYKTHDVALACIGKYKLMESSKNGANKKKLDIIMQLLDLKFSEETSENDKIDDFKLQYVSPFKVMKRIPFVKDSKFNFDNYLMLLQKENLAMPEDE